MRSSHRQRCAHRTRLAAGSARHTGRSLSPCSSSTTHSALSEVRQTCPHPAPLHPFSSAPPLRARSTTRQTRPLKEFPSNFASSAFAFSPRARSSARRSCPHPCAAAPLTAPPLPRARSTPRQTRPLNESPSAASCSGVALAKARLTPGCVLARLRRAVRKAPSLALRARFCVAYVRDRTFDMSCATDPADSSRQMFSPSRRGVRLLHTFH